MKNILIPTSLEADTVTAVQSAIKQAHGKNCAIILMLAKEADDAYSASALLRKTNAGLTDAQYEILQKCSLLTKVTDNCHLELHNQVGLSAPLVKNLITGMGIGLIVLSASYKAEQGKLHQYCCQLLLNSKSPILHLCKNAPEPDFTKALYLEDEKAKFGLMELQQSISSHFPFKIISQATVAEEQNPEDLAPLLAEAISKNDIGLLVQTRKVQKIKRKQPKNAVSEVLGLPVLSIYEGVV